MSTDMPRLDSVQCLSPAGLHRMCWREWGDPDNPDVLICVHGLTRRGTDFETLARVMSDRYRVVCPDVAGRGDSDWLKEPALYVVPQYVSDMVTLLARLNARQVDWFGTSMGGLIGMGLASLENAPVRRLLINDVGPRIEWSALERIGAYVGQPIRFDTVDAGIAYLNALSVTFGEHEEHQWRAMNLPMLRERDGAWGLHYDPAISAAFRILTPQIAESAEAAMWKAFEAIRCETLVVRGGDSDLLSAATLEEMMQRGQNVRSHVIPGVGHAPSFMHPSQIAVARSFFLE